MEKIKQILAFIGTVFAWFNGKKTNIGATLLFTAFAAKKILLEFWGVDSDVVDNSIETLEWIGGVLTGVGLGHKGAKWMGK